MALNCLQRNGNTGNNTCEKLHKARAITWLMFMEDGDGNANSIDPATFNQAALVAAINHADPLKRIYPVRDNKTITSVRADGDSQEFDDKTANYFDNGTRTVSMLVNKATVVLYKNTKNLVCGGNRMGEIVIQKNGNIAGENYGTDDLIYPREIYTSSAKVTWLEPGENIMQGFNMTYQYDPSVLDENIALFDIEGTDLQTLRAEGLYNVYSEISGISTTGATIALFLEDAQVGKRYPVTGLVTADFVSSVGGATGKIYNQTDALDVTVTATETATPGTYTLAWVAQTLADVLVPFAKKNKYDFTPIKTNTITIV